MKEITPKDLKNALSNIRAILSPTPLTYSPLISDQIDRAVYLKWDSKFTTGSFKERGAVNFLLNLNSKQRKGGVCAASAGNHALALGYHAARLEIPCTIIMPVHAPLVKIRRTEAYGARVILSGASFDEANDLALKLAQKERLTLVPAFNHRDIILGQATAAMEIVDQCMEFDGLIGPIGGGGLMAGISSFLRVQKKPRYLVGVQSTWATSARTKTLRSSLKPLSIADGIAVKKIGDITGPILKRSLDRIISVGEDEITGAIVKYLEFERAVVEGAGAASLAGLLKLRLPKKVKSVVLLVCGSNIDISVLSRAIDQSKVSAGELIKCMVPVPDRPGSLAALTNLVAEMGANVIEVKHDRSFSNSPRSVMVEMTLEVRDRKHGDEIRKKLEEI